MNEPQSRRRFLADVGKGTLLATVGPALASEFGITSSLAEERPSALHFGEMESLVCFMQETPVIALALEGENIITRVRDLLGPTDSTTAAPGTIRGDFGDKSGDSKMRNVCHASDSPEAAAAEIKRFFKDGEIFSF